MDCSHFTDITCPLGVGLGQNLGLRDFCHILILLPPVHPCFSNTCLVIFLCCSIDRSGGALRRHIHIGNTWVNSIPDTVYCVEDTDRSLEELLVVTTVDVSAFHKHKIYSYICIDQ